MNLLAVAVIAICGPLLIPLFHATGAAITAVVGETALAAGTLAVLLRARPTLRPNPAPALKVLVAAGFGVTFLLIPGLSSLESALVVIAAYTAACLFLGALPRELLDALVAIRHR